MGLKIELSEKFAIIIIMSKKIPQKDKKLDKIS